MNKTILITGGARGIGLETARLFARQGARVALTATHQDSIDQALSSLPDEGEVKGYRCNAADNEAVSRTTRAIVQELGDIDILVNNAGILHVGDFDEFTIAQINAMVDINIKGVLYHTHAVLPAMRARGAGTIINIASGAGQAGFARLTTYCTSKFAVVGFTEALADEVSGQGVRVYAVCPGKVKTDMQVLYSGAKVGIAPQQVAERVAQLAGPRPGVRPGQCVSP